MKPTELNDLLARHADAEIARAKAAGGPHAAAAVKALEAEKAADKVADVYCSQAKNDETGAYLFAAAKLTSGRYAAVTEGHAAKFDTLDELQAALNRHELELLRYKVKG